LTNLGRFFIVATRNLFIESLVALINISHTCSIKVIPSFPFSQFFSLVHQPIVASALSFMGISSHLWWLETAMIELLKVEVSKSFPVVVAAWLDGNWQRCVDSFDAVLLDCN
jgi:hypothetical protein